MKNELANDPAHERYVVEIDGIATLEYRVFVRALTAGLQLKQDFRAVTSNCARHVRTHRCVRISPRCGPDRRRASAGLHKWSSGAPLLKLFVPVIGSDISRDLIGRALGR
jgi:hypothetical protein